VIPLKICGGIFFTDATVFPSSGFVHRILAVGFTGSNRPANAIISNPRCPRSKVDCFEHEIYQRVRSGKQSSGKEKASPALNFVWFVYFVVYSAARPH